MSIEFYKYQGTGNDFILVDDRKNTFPQEDVPLIRSMCGRRWGIGSDGLILLRNLEGFDFEMIFFNPDGSQSFCGNGSRCAVAFAHDLGIIPDACTFKAIDGLHKGGINGPEVSVSMQDVQEIKNVSQDAYFIHTGSPHYIRYVQDVNTVKLVEESVVIRYANEYKPGGTNVNFVEERDGGIVMRTYERGVEDETLSCGTGVTAAAISFMHKHRTDGKVKVSTRGGELTVEAHKNANGYNRLWLTGPTGFIYKGTYGK